VVQLDVKYVHTNLVAKDWNRLAEFYIKVFGCKEELPERNLKGNWLDSLTAIRNVHIEGIHLRLPGYGKHGPTLEVFQYSRKAAGAIPTVNRPGYGHIAFAVEDVKIALAKVKKYGGGTVGDVISTEIPGIGNIEVVYARDPEGNIVELQKWQ
jgi:predicted enzyme related to lactoylglutathione lyase